LFFCRMSWSFGVIFCIGVCGFCFFLVSVVRCLLFLFFFGGGGGCGEGVKRNRQNVLQILV
jgi:hypothetical protein